MSRGKMETSSFVLTATGNNSWSLSSFIFAKHGGAAAQQQLTER